eukprot:scaffold64976_cov48-Phaeocystis_antarctica.AAC.3
MGPQRARRHRHLDQVYVHIRHSFRQRKAIMQLRPEAMLEAEEPALAKVQPGRPEGRAVHAARELTHQTEGGQATPVREAHSVPYRRQPARLGSGSGIGSGSGSGLGLGFGLGLGSGPEPGLAAGGMLRGAWRQVPACVLRCEVRGVASAGDVGLPGEQEDLVLHLGRLPLGGEVGTGGPGLAPWHGGHSARHSREHLRPRRLERTETLGRGRVRDKQRPGFSASLRLRARRAGGRGTAAAGGG